MTPGPSQKKGGKTVVMYTVLRKFSKHEAEYAACITWKWAVWGYMIKRAPHYFRPPTYPPPPHIQHNSNGAHEEEEPLEGGVSNHGAAVPPGEGRFRPPGWWSTKEGVQIYPKSLPNTYYILLVH